MSAHGIIVLLFPPSRLRAGQHEVAAEIRSALASGQQRGRPGIDAVGA